MNGAPAEFDVLVVGAGPAGSACAARLAERGRSVLLIDRAVPGRERVCGGFLGPEFVDWMRMWGWGGDLARLEAWPIGRVQVSGSGPGSVQTALAGTGGRAVDRGSFDRWVADLAARRGAVLKTGVTAEALGRDGGQWRARLSDGSPVLAGAWVDATGRRPASDTKKQAAFFACKADYENVSGLGDSVALHFVERGHVGLNPLGSGRVTLCLCVSGEYLRAAAGDLDGMLRALARMNPTLAAQIATARRLTAWKTCQAEPDGHPRFFHEGRFFAGDALSMVNPVVGGGIPIAMQSGVLLADLLASAPPGTAEERTASEFERAWKSSFASKFRLAGWLGAAERSALGSRLVLNAVSVFPAALSRLVRWSRPAPEAV